MDGYCVKCKKKRTMNDEKEGKSSTGMHVMRGTCSTCGTKMCRILGKEK